MSWLGDSFANLRGQLSTLTKEVLSEGREEVTDYEAELNAANKRVRELENYSSNLRCELEKMRVANAELEERCQSSELQVNSLTAQYRSLLQQQQTSSVQALHGGDTSGPDPHAIRVQELESHLKSVTDGHQAELAALQDHYAQELALLRSRMTATEDEQEIAPPSCDLPAENESLRKELQQLRKEKEDLEQSLVALDQQNKEAIEEILIIKQNLAQENNKLKEELEELRAKLQQKGNVFTPDLEVSDLSLESSQNNVQPEPVQAEHETESEESELAKLKEKNTELESQVKQSTLECERLVCQVTEAQARQAINEKKIDDLSRELDALKEEKENSEETINNLENTHLLQVQSYREQMSEMEEKLHLLNTELHDTKVAFFQMEAKHKTLQNKVEGLTQEASSLEAERDELEALLEEKNSEIKLLNAQLKKNNVPSKQHDEGKIDTLSQQGSESLPSSEKSYEDLKQELDTLKAKLNDGAFNEDSFRESIIQSFIAEALEKRLDKMIQTDIDESDMPQKPYEDLETEISLLKMTLLDLESLNKRLIDEIHAITNLTGKKAILEASNVHETNEKNATKLESILIDLEHHKEKHLELMHDNEDLKMILANKEAQLQTFQQELDSKTKEINSLQQTIHTLEAQIAKESSAQQELSNEDSIQKANLIEQLGNKIKQLEFDKEQVLQVLTEKSREISTLKMENHRLVNVIYAEKKALDKLHQENQQEESEDKKELEKFKKCIVDKEQEIEKLKEKVSSLLERVQSCEQGNTTNTEESSGKEDPEVLKLQNEQVRLQSLVENLQQSLLQLQQKCTHYESLLSQEREKQDQLERQFQSLSQQYETKQNSLLNSNKEILLVKQKLSERDQLYDGLLTQFKELQRSNREQVVQLQNHSQELKKLVEEKERMLTEKQILFENLEEELKNVTHLLHLKENDIQSFVNIISKPSEDNKSLEKTSEVGSRSLTECLQQLINEKNYLANELASSKESEGKLAKELERLRSHLLHVEESYTQEAITAEQREVELRQQIAQLEERCAAESAAGMADQRDAALAQVSELEDRLQQTTASLSNLQLVLDHFHREREREVQQLQEHHEAELAAVRAETQAVRDEVARKERQLQEASAALDAAARLSAQLDAKDAQVQALRLQVQELNKLLEKQAQEIEAARSNTEGKVDRQIIKNLVLNYVAAPDLHKGEVMRILAKVLDFNNNEMEKAGIKIGKEGSTSWWGKAAGTATEGMDQSLSAAFIKFLETESQPKKPPLKLPIDRTQDSFKLNLQ